MEGTVSMAHGKDIRSFGAGNRGGGEREEREALPPCVRVVTDVHVSFIHIHNQSIPTTCIFPLDQLFTTVLLSPPPPSRPSAAALQDNNLPANTAK